MMCAMCELAVSSYDWISVSTLECSQQCFITFDEVEALFCRQQLTISEQVVSNIEHYLQEQLPLHNCRCFFRCGADLVLR